jgi:NAD-dependent deacetylase
MLFEKCWRISQVDTTIPPELAAALAEIIPLTAQAQRIAVLTGAGVSAESGIPTFRDAQTGLWAKYDPVMLASPEGFAEDPRRVWQWYDERRHKMRQCGPNPGHVALAQWERRWRELGREFHVLTQNIDGLHTLAGSSEVIELHGNIWYARPTQGAYSDARLLNQCPLAELPPRDERGRLLRPHVVWFGETLNPAVLTAAFESTDRCDLMLVVGTSSWVYPAAALPHAVLRRRAAVVEINPNPTELTRYATHALGGPSGQVLPALWRAVEKQVESICQI